MFTKYDIIVVGAGHAGCEAAAAAARMGSKVLLVTMRLDNIAQMSCNPAIGGVAKGQIVREIDALGGLTGIVTDESMIQFRMLNRSKGPAMWSPRAQCDRLKFSSNWRKKLEEIPNLHFWQDTVNGIITKNNIVCGVKTELGIEIESDAVILTNGTFLNGIIHIGLKQFGGGRLGDNSSNGLTEQLEKIGFESARLKTGTPVRVDGRSIDFSEMEEQEDDDIPGKFSYTETSFLEKHHSCYLTWTNQKVHDILRTGFEQSPMFTGKIAGTGPRYCPSIEDKIDRFSDKNRHQLFVEPEGLDNQEYYINGFSSSLPENIQFEALKEIPGFKNARILRPGYAIEYDYFPPQQLYSTMETKLVKNLYFAGQINGTTGYEEAGAQGLMAGINAHQKLNNLSEINIKRSEGYIGVLIDDLITKGIDEPYRMFTSRAEYRILLRQDNADMRLSELGFKLGLISDERLQKVKKKKENIDSLIKFLRIQKGEPQEMNPLMEKMGTSILQQKQPLSSLLLRPQIKIEALIEHTQILKEFVAKHDFIKEEIEAAGILVKYESYIEREKEMASRMRKMDELIIRKGVNYKEIVAISFEAREKLDKYQPQTIGQASRISGVSPSDITALVIHLGILS